MKQKGLISSYDKSALFSFDSDIKEQNNAGLIIGTDEAGRGPLCGPVVACAAFIPPGIENVLSGIINDSKKLSPLKREEAFSFMIKCGVKFGFAYSSAEEIDRSDILTCSLKSMLVAIRRLERQLPTLSDSKKNLVLVDGNRKIRDSELWQQTIVGGDAKSASIAAASIFAKVIRDRWLMLLDSKYPQYGFAKHKGYGTKAHIAAIEQYGPCPEHRFTFAPIKGNFSRNFSNGS